MDLKDLANEYSARYVCNENIFNLLIKISIYIFLPNYREESAMHNDCQFHMSSNFHTV